MLIKYQALAGHLQKKLQAIYVLIGQDHYLLNDAALLIKKAWRQQSECDEKSIHINATADWNQLLDEANSYSLFAERVLLDARYDKKTVDAAGKTALGQYVKNINSRCLIILHAHHVPAKQLQWLSDNEHVTVVQVVPLTDQALLNFINTQLQQRSIRYPTQVPALIHQYTKGNMLACAQVIEKLSLICDESTELTLETVQEQLIDQCEFQLYELADACLAANAAKTIHLLRQAREHRAEPTLILWLLCQEIRLLIQLSHAIKQKEPFSTACSKLKIWPQRANLYQAALTRLPLNKLYALLHDSQQLDERIKTNQGNAIWHGFERLSLALC